jgi:glycine cleavage system H protein
MNFPSELKYTKEHEWVRIEGDIATVGITDFAQSELGDIVFVEIETQGETMGSGDTFGTVEAVKTVSDLYMPLSGEIVEVNADLQSNPENINEDPYQKGWMIKIKMSDSSEANALMDAANYRSTTGH